MHHNPMRHTRHTTIRLFFVLKALAREYNAAHAPIPISQPKAALRVQLEQRGVFREESAHELVAKLVESVAQAAADWALRAHEEREEERRERRRRRRSNTENQAWNPQPP